MSDLTRLKATSPAIAVYASQPLSPVATQHSLPSRTLPFTWAGLSPAGSHQLCLAHSFNHLIAPSKIGRASCRERVSIIVVAVPLNNNKFPYECNRIIH